MRGGGRDPLLYVGVELGARGIDRVAGVEESRIGREPSEEIVERLIALHRAGRGPLGKRRELTFVGLLECEAFGSTAIEIALHLRIIEPGIEVREIPFRQRAETGHGRSLECSMSGGAFGSCRHDKLRRTSACQRRHRATSVARTRCRASLHMGPCGPRSTPWARQHYEPSWVMVRNPGKYSGAGVAKVSASSWPPPPRK